MEIDSEPLTSIGVWTITREVPDRIGDIVRVAGLDTSDFEANPVLLYSHNSTQPIGLVNLMAPEQGQRRAEFFIAAKANEHASRALREVEAGILKGCSLGFMPIEATHLDDGGMDYKRSKLIEISLTATPMNASALREAKEIDGQNIVFKSIEIDTMTEIVTTEPTSTEQTTEAQAQQVKTWAPAVHTKPPRQYSLAKAIGSHLNLAGAGDSAFEREIAEELVRRNPGKSWAGVPVPFKAMFPVTKASAGAVGGNLADFAGVQYADDLLSIQGAAIPREFLASMLGVSIVSTSERTLQIPMVTGKVAGVVVALDGNITASDPTVDTAEVTPVTVGASTKVKRSAFYAHHASGEEVIRAQIANAVREKIDEVLIGPASGAMPNGILDDASTATVATVPDTESGWRVFREEVRSYLKNPAANIRFCLPYSLGNTLATTPRMTGSEVGILNDLDGIARIAGTECVLTHELDDSVPATVPILVGDFSEMFLVLFNQGGLDVTANPWITGSWESGGYELRALCDIGAKLRDTSAVIQAVSNQS